MAEKKQQAIADVNKPATDEGRMNAAKQATQMAEPMIARIHLGLGEIDEAFEWLRKGIEERSYWVVFLKMDPVYDEIRSDPRFLDLLRAVRLVA